MGEIHDYLKTPNGEREVDLPTCVAKLLMQFIGNRKRGLLFCNRQQLGQRNILRLFHKAVEEIGFEQAGAHAFRRYRNTFLRRLARTWPRGPRIAFRVAGDPPGIVMPIGFGLNSVNFSPATPLA